MTDECPRRPVVDIAPPSDPCRAALRTIPAAFAWCASDDALVKLRDRFAPVNSAAFQWWDDFMPASLLETPVTVLHGPTGAGKTSAAVVALCWLCGAYPTQARAIGARFIPARDLCPPSATGRPERIREALDATVLILDEVGQEADVSGWEREQRLDRTRLLLSDRFDRKATTIITTPLSARQWGELYGGGIERRYWTEADVRLIAMQAPPVRAR